MKIRSILMNFLYPLFFLPLFPLNILADDTGMVKARLFEDSIGVYVLEVDINPQLLGFISYPELPERFKGSEKTAIKGESSLITVNYFFSCPDEPLKPEDVILLNWNRRGISMTAQWQDGEYVRSFFTRGPGGFSIPIKKLREVTELYPDLNQKQFLGGLKYPFGSLAYLLFIIFLIYIARRKDPIKFLFALFAGQAVSLILIELGMIALPMGIVELVMLLAILIATVSIVKFSQKDLLSMFFIVGILSGLGFGLAFKGTGIPGIDILTASFFFHLGLDFSLLALFLIVHTIFKLLNLFEQKHKYEKIMFYGIGSFAVLFFLITFNAIQGNEKTYGLNLPGNPEAAKIQIPKSLLEKAAALSKPLPISALQNPVEVFLSVEPYEVKYEVLVKISELKEWTENYQELKRVINIEDQNQLIEALLQDISKASLIELDGRQAVPFSQRGNFVTMTSTGIFTRPAAIDENTEEAIVGLNYIFKFEGMPNKVLFRWNGFTENFTRLPVTSSDPVGGDKVILRDNEDFYEWSNRLKGFRVQEIKPIEVTTYPLPLLSIVIFIIAGIYITFRKINRISIAWVDSRVIYGLLAIAFILYPFLRFGVFLPFIDNWKPNVHEAEMLSGALLTNVYRSLDLRDEEAVYNRLALTVFGDQLSEIYLQSRKSMELENRGGARGKVNDVEILKIKSIKDLDDDRIAIELEWKVSGSVTHFGHTHYRQNKNNALMTIKPVNEVWKVESIDIIDEKRLL